MKHTSTGQVGQGREEALTGIPFYPSSETKLVLTQAGVDTRTVNDAIEDYAELSIQFPDLVERTDKGFYWFCRAKYPKQTGRALKNLFPERLWTPGNAELETLESEGYWRDLISHAHVHWLCIQGKPKQLVSNFGHFRSFIQRLLPLNDISIEQWSPCSFFEQILNHKHGIAPSAAHRLLPEGRTIGLSLTIKPSHFPRWYYNHVITSTSSQANMI